MAEPKPQILYIHGGMTFKNRQDYLDFLANRPVSIEEKLIWNEQYLKTELGQDFQIIKPRMPLQDYAQYQDWKIHFERLIPQLRPEIILIGYSLGGIFLAKYLSEQSFPHKIKATYLIGAPFDNTLPGEDLVGGFELSEDLSLFNKNSPQIYLYFSSTDRTVAPEHGQKYLNKLPSVHLQIFDNVAGHFRSKEFPELIASIKSQLAK